ncbi:hypothetical protein [Halalkalibacter okhensis]|nr:hypothetical protein [Halalkalibacter okhensis]
MPEYHVKTDGFGKVVEVHEEGHLLPLLGIAGVVAIIALFGGF